MAYSQVASLSMEDIQGWKLALFKSAIQYMKQELENDKIAAAESKKLDWDFLVACLLAFIWNKDSRLKNPI